MANIVIINEVGVQGPQGIQGPPGPPGVAVTELFTNIPNTNTWFTTSSLILSGSILFGTASWAYSASQAFSSSYALSTSFASTTDTSALVFTSSFNNFTQSIQTQVNNLATATSSYVLNSITASMLQPYVLTAVTSSMTVLSSSYAVSSSYNLSSSYAISSSYSLSGSYAVTASYVLNAISSSFATTASFATSVTASILDPYVLNSSTSSMRVLSSSFATTASRLEGSFRLTTTGNAAAQTISALGGLAFNNLATVDIDGTGTVFVKTTTTDVAGLSTRLTISGSGQIGINTTPFTSASLTVSGGVILNGTSPYFTPYSSWPVQLHSGQANNGIGIYSDVVGQYGYGSASPYYQFGSGGSATWRLATATNQGFLIQNVQPSLNTRVYVSASGYVGIGTSTPLSNLHVYKGLSGASLLGLEDGITLTLENDTTNYINFRSPNNVYAGLAFTTPADNSAGYIALRQSTGDMIFSNEKSTGYHTFQTADTERLRIANTETTVRNNLIISGATSQFTASGTSLFNGKVDIFGTSSTLNISGSTIGGVTINVSSSLPTQPALLISQQGTGSAVTVSGSGYVNLGYSAEYRTGGRLNVFGNTYIEGQLYFTGTTGVAIQNGTANRALINFGTIGNSYLNNGNLGLGTTTPTQRLTVVGSSSFSGDVYVTGSLIVSGSNVFIGNQTVTGSLLTSGSNNLLGSTTLTGSLSISGSTTQTGNNTLIGTTTLTGSILINGNITPQISSSFDLGSETNPWRAIYVQSGSISIQSDIPGGIPAIISNANGNVTFAGAGFQLKSGSFVPFEVASNARTIIRVPDIPANDVGGLSIIGSSNGAYQGVTNAGGLLHLTSNDGQSSRITSDAYGTTAVAAYVGRKARGTAASPSPVLSGDTLTRISTIGWTGTDYGFTMSSSLTTAPTSIDVVALENYTTSSFGSRFNFYSVPTGSTIRTLSTQIDTTGITIPSTSRFFGTASWASNAQTASYVNPLRQDVIITGSLRVSGSLTEIGNTVFSGSVTLSSGSALNINDGFYVNGNKQFNYGAFCSTGSQTNLEANVSRSMQLDTTEHSVGVSVVAGSRITFAHAGVYNIQFSAQLQSTSAGDNTVNIWFKKNGTNVARSNTLINVAKQAGDTVVAAWNYVDTANANDYYEIMWQAADTHMQLLAAAATGNIPSTPSVIVTATQVM